jgi:hypothetical protein
MPQYELLIVGILYKLKQNASVEVTCVRVFFLSVYALVPAPNMLDKFS